MKPVDQTILHSEATKGNCFAACIASLLELRCDEVPNFVERIDWLPFATSWLANRDLGLIYLTPEAVALFWHVRECYVLIGGKSPRGAFGHSVVGLLHRGELTVVHDPHPSRAGLSGPPEDVGLLIALNQLTTVLE
jgi:hypothetical protein